MTAGGPPRVHSDPGSVTEPGRLGPAEGSIALLAANWPRVDDGLQIRAGGAVAVDTATLSATAVRFDGVRDELGEIGERLRGLQAARAGLTGCGGDAGASASALARKLDEARAEGDAIARALRDAAYAYEMVDLQAEHRAAVLAGDGDRAARLDARLTAMADEHPDAWRMALGAQFGHAVMWPSELVRQATQWGTIIGDGFGDPGAIAGGAAAGLLTLGAATVVGLTGTGRLARDARLSGSAGPVTVTPVTPAARGGAAPQSLAAATERIPGGADARVRVERYTMPDGSRQYAVYIAGMQSFALGGDDPWDDESNLQLYSGETSDSYAATEAALAAAGVQPGDAVHVFGFSQGAMIGAHLALQGDYDTRTLVSIGSPVDADVGSGTLSVSLRHTDDPVAGLAGGGHGEAVGAAGGFVAERVSDPAPAIEDARLPAHRLAAYAETAALVDASNDPRVDGLRAVFDGLGEAEAVEVTEYAATRGDG